MSRVSYVFEFLEEKNFKLFCQKKIVLKTNTCFLSKDFAVSPVSTVPRVSHVFEFLEEKNVKLFVQHFFLKFLF